MNRKQIRRNFLDGPPQLGEANTPRRMDVIGECLLYDEVPEEFPMNRITERMPKLGLVYKCIIVSTQYRAFPALAGERIRTIFVPGGQGPDSSMYTKSTGRPV